MRIPKLMDATQHATLVLALDRCDVEQDTAALRDLAWLLGEYRRVGVAYRTGSEAVLRQKCAAIGLDPDPYFARMHAAMGAWPSGIEATKPEEIPA